MYALTIIIIIIIDSLTFSIVTDSDIRFCVLSSLDERFDAHLAQAENLSALFVALNDEVSSGCHSARLSGKGYCR